MESKVAVSVNGAGGQSPAGSGTGEKKFGRDQGRERKEDKQDGGCRAADGKLVEGG